jgi:hypothetical protein
MTGLLRDICELNALGRECEGNRAGVFKKTGRGIRGLPQAQERVSRQGASGRRAEAEHDADGVDCEGGESWSEADSVEVIMGEKCKKR